MKCKCQVWALSVFPPLLPGHLQVYELFPVLAGGDWGAPTSEAPGSLGQQCLLHPHGVWPPGPSQLHTVGVHSGGALALPVYLLCDLAPGSISLPLCVMGSTGSWGCLGPTWPLAIELMGLGLSSHRQIPHLLSPLCHLQMVLGGLMSPCVCV